MEEFTVIRKENPKFQSVFRSAGSTGREPCLPRERGV
jgi:hypothetical protein